MKPTVQDLAAVIQIHGVRGERRPSGKGWQTIREIAKAEGLTTRAIQLRLRLAASNGIRIERFLGTQVGMDGFCHRQTYYRVIP